MKDRQSLLVLLACLTLALCLGCSSEPDTPDHETDQTHQKRSLAFGGGPTGGTFNFFANKMAAVIAADCPWLTVTPRGSGGSAENLRTLNRNSLDFGIVYSGDAFLGRHGKLPGDTASYIKVQALSFLYGAPAQLVVRKNSGITGVYDLKGKTVAVGNPGSGAALSAERFFRHLGLWDAITVNNYGYSQAATAFIAGQVDAFWVLVGYPNTSIIEAAARVPISLLNLHEVAVKSGFYNMYPFYEEETIPAATYAGQDTDVATFQDAALWCASEAVPEAVVRESLKAVYSTRGIKSLAAAHKAAGGLSTHRGIQGVSIPLHPGAVRFWQQQGLDIPSIILP